MATSNMSAARRFLYSLQGRDDSSREGLMQLRRALDLAEEHDARAVKPVAQERPLHERALAALRTHKHRLPIATADLFSQALSRLGVLERERNSPPQTDIQVEVADDLDVMSLGELCERYNTQRRTIENMLTERHVLRDKLTEILKNTEA